MLIRLMLIAGAALLLSGCNTTKAGLATPKQQREAQAKAAVEVCKARVSAKQITKLADYSRCVAAARAPAYADLEEYADLLRLIDAKQTAIYERVDNHEITLSQAEAEMAEVRSKAVSEMQRRYSLDVALSPKPTTCMPVAGMFTCF